jgi:hypothetical protein
MAEQLANRASSTLNGAIDNVVTSLTVANGTVFPASGNFRIVIDSEIIIVGARAGNVLSSLTRGAEGTAAASHANAAAVDHYLTKGGLDAYLKDATHLTNSGTPDGTKFIRDDMVVADLNVLIGVRVLTGAGTYTPTAGTKRVLVCCIGGGGGGGGTPSTGAGSALGGGGGGGGYSEKLLTTGFSGASYSVGAGGTNVAGAAGGAGGDSSFGTGPLVLAKGGSGGPAGVSATNVGGSAGGLASAGIGDVKLDGQNGQVGAVTGGGPMALGEGGDAPRGGMGGRRITFPSTSIVAGVAGGQYGAGGSGAAVNNVAATGAGGAGGAGTIIVYEYA